MGIMDPSPFIDVPPPPASAAWQGMGPQMAAQGRIGGLQQALTGRVGGGQVQVPQAIPLPASKPIVGDSAMSRMEAGLMSRIRSPEDLEQAAQRRRGALETLQQATLAPSDDYTWDTHFMEGIMNTPGLSAADAFSFGVANAMKAGREKQAARKAAQIAAAKNAFEFETLEEKAADSAEKSALSDVAKIAIAQNKLANAGKGGAGGGNIFRYYKDGIYRNDMIDPDTGGPLKVRDYDDKTAKAFEGAVRVASREASDPNLTWESAEQKSAWVNNRAQEIMNLHQELTGAGVGAPSGVGGNTGSVLPSPTSSGGASTPKAGGVTDNNVGNLRPIGKSEGFQQFETKEEGIAALNKDLEAKGKRGVNTIRGLISIYAPENENNTDAYVAAVSQRTGIKPDQEIDLTDPAVRHIISGAMMIQEKGVDFFTKPPVMKSKTQQAREEAFVKKDEESLAKVLDNWNTAGDQANEALNTVNNVQQLRGSFTPGKLAPIRQEMGAYLDALGLTKGGLPKEARTMQQVNKLIRREVNARITLEKGVQTEGDNQRLSAEYAQLGDTPEAFDFSMNFVKENALRNQERVRIAREFSKSNGTNAGVQEAWNNYRDNQLGPMLLKIGDKAIFRHEYIDRAVQSTLDANPGGDPEEARRMAEQAWLNRAAQTKTKTNREKNNGVR